MPISSSNAIKSKEISTALKDNINGFELSAPNVAHKDSCFQTNYNHLYGENMWITECPGETIRPS